MTDEKPASHATTTTTDNDDSKDYTAVVAALSDGWVKAMGVRFVRVTKTEVIAELEVGPQHLQPLGIVHGGVYAGLVETVTSIGAGVNVMLEGRLSVGLENHTSFMHAVRQGVIRATARPLTRGRRTHVWEATIVDEKGRVAATGRVRFIVLEQDSPLAGEGAALKGGGGGGGGGPPFPGMPGT